MSKRRFEAIASRLEAIALRLEAIALRLKAVGCHRSPSLLGGERQITEVDPTKCHSGTQEQKRPWSKKVKVERNDGVNRNREQV